MWFKPWQTHWDVRVAWFLSLKSPSSVLLSSSRKCVFSSSPRGQVIEVLLSICVCFFFFYFFTGLATTKVWIAKTIKRYFFIFLNEKNEIKEGLCTVQNVLLYFHWNIKDCNRVNNLHLTWKSMTRQLGDLITWCETPVANISVDTDGCCSRARRY